LGKNNIHTCVFGVERAGNHLARRRQLSIQGNLEISFLAIARMPIQSQALPGMGAIREQMLKRIDSVWAISKAPL
jgi:hypothetical protein